MQRNSRTLVRLFVNKTASYTLVLSHIHWSYQEAIDPVSKQLADYTMRFSTTLHPSANSRLKSRECADYFSIPIGAAGFHGFANRICEGTEQISGRGWNQ